MKQKHICMCTRIAIDFVLLYVFRLNIIIELNELFKEIVFISFIIIIIMIDCFTNIMIDFVIIKIAPLFMDLKWNFFFNFLNKFQNFFLWFRKSIFFCFILFQCVYIGDEHKTNHHNDQITMEASFYFIFCKWKFK